MREADFLVDTNILISLPRLSSVKTPDPEFLYGLRNPPANTPQ
jgi:hypothetical protein